MRASREPDMLGMNRRATGVVPGRDCKLGAERSGAEGNPKIVKTVWRAREGIAGVARAGRQGGVVAVAPTQQQKRRPRLAAMHQDNDKHRRTVCGGGVVWDD